MFELTKARCNHYDGSDGIGIKAVDACIIQRSVGNRSDLSNRTN